MPFGQDAPGRHGDASLGGRGEPSNSQFRLLYFEWRNQILRRAGVNRGGIALLERPFMESFHVEERTPTLGGGELLVAGNV